MGIAVGSSTQIALFVIPVLTLAGWALGQNMTLEFPPIEVRKHCTSYHAFSPSQVKPPCPRPSPCPLHVLSLPFSFNARSNIRVFQHLPSPPQSAPTHLLSLRHVTPPHNQPLDNHPHYEHHRRATCPIKCSVELVVGLSPHYGLLLLWFCLLF